MGMEGWMDGGSQRAVAARELLSAVLWRHVAEVWGQVSRSAVEAGGTRRKLGPHRVSSKTPDCEINEEFTPSL